jgi:hypothetical protein
MKVLLVTGGGYCGTTSWTADRWFRVAIALGAYRHPESASRIRLRTIGADWTESIRLPVSDTGLSDQVAAMIRDDDNWHRVLLVGRKVMQCFGITGHRYWGMLLNDKYVCLPHPSGRNQWWSLRSMQAKEENAGWMAHEMTRRALSVHAVGRCRQCTSPIFPGLDADGRCPACLFVDCRKKGLV